MRLELLDGADLEGLPEEAYDLVGSLLKLLSEFDENEGWHGDGRSRMLDSQYGIRYRIAEWKHDTICFQTQNRKGD